MIYLGHPPTIIHPAKELWVPAKPSINRLSRTDLAAIEAALIISSANYHAAGGGGSPPALDGHQEVFTSGGTTLVSPALVTTSTNDIINALISVYEGAGQSVVSVVGSTLGAFTPRGSAYNSGRRGVESWYCKSPGTLAGEVITATLAVGMSFGLLSVFGVSGANYAGTFFDAGGPGLNAHSALYASMTTLNPNTFIFGVACDVDSTVAGSDFLGAGWTTLYTGVTQQVTSGYRTSTGTGTFTLTTQVSAGNADGALIDALRA